MARYQKVQGTHGVYLLPTMIGPSQSGGDAYKRAGMEYAIASLPEVRQVMKATALKAYSKAQGLLGVIRAAAFSFGDIRDHWVQLDLEVKRIDAYLVLTDTKNGQKGAMSIEYGRDEYELQRNDGSVAKIGAMTGKFLLHRAFGVPPKSLEGTGGGDIP